MKKQFKFELGQEVKDKYSSVVGLIMSRTQYFTGCIQYSVFIPSLDKDGYPKDWLAYDEARLVKTKVAAKKSKGSPGGPMPTSRSTNR